MLTARRAGGEQQIGFNGCGMMTGGTGGACQVPVAGQDIGKKIDQHASQDTSEDVEEDGHRVSSPIIRILL